MGLTVVSGVVSTLVDIGQDETWLRDWLRERPARLGLGELHVIEDPEVEVGATAFLADDDTRVFSVGVRLGELQAADAFSVLQGWADSRAHAPEKDHVAMLVTERLPERYRGTLEALAERLPLVVVGLSVWRGESEAIVVPHVVLASGALDLASAPAAAAASAMATTQAETARGVTTAKEAGAGAEGAAVSTTREGAPGQGGEIGEPSPVEATTDTEAAGEAEAITRADAPDEDGNASPEAAGDEAGEGADPLARLGSRDDTGISDPWRLGRSDSESSPLEGSYTAVGSR